MSIFLEITQLENGDVVLREAAEGDAADQGEGNPAPGEGGAIVIRRPSAEPLVRIRFSREVNDMLGPDAVGVAEAMIDAATDFLDGLGDGVVEGDEGDDASDPESPPPVVH
jgi:hypothetical protein